MLKSCLVNEIKWRIPVSLGSILRFNLFETSKNTKIYEFEYSWSSWTHLEIVLCWFKISET